MRSYFSVDQIWKDHTVVIFGGGGSVTASLFRFIAIARLENRCRVIAVNDAVYPAWWADWLHSADYKWWQANIQCLQSFQGIKTTIDDLVPQQWANLLRVTGRCGFDLSPTCIRTGNGGGYQAIHSAIHTSPKRIILLGFDMGGERWHDSTLDEYQIDYPAVMLPHFESLIPSIEERHIEVVCATPSPLPFRQVDIKSVL